jgi:hypothetical protein
VADDVRKTLKDLITAHINPIVITKDDNVTMATYIIEYESPPWIILQDFIITQGYDLVFTVGRTLVTPKRFLQGVPLIYDGRYPVSTWCVDKTGITGTKLKWKADEELERVFEDNPGTFSQAIDLSQDDDHVLGSVMLYNTRHIIKHKRYRT